MSCHLAGEEGVDCFYFNCIFGGLCSFPHGAEGLFTMCNGLQCVIVTFPGHIRLFYFTNVPRSFERICL